ncbi:MAG: hypothetical protein D6696_03170 [Acidobacteria bacterium]|nr:MAG: hypothetical protein D6696_03170 [Acidobacteriota bacterium]
MSAAIGALRQAASSAAGSRARTLNRSRLFGLLFITEPSLLASPLADRAGRRSGRSRRIGLAPESV